MFVRFCFDVVCFVCVGGFCGFLFVLCVGFFVLFFVLLLLAVCVCWLFFVCLFVVVCFCFFLLLFLYYYFLIKHIQCLKMYEISQYISGPYHGQNFVELFCGQNS